MVEVRGRPEVCQGAKALQAVLKDQMLWVMYNAMLLHLAEQQHSRVCIGLIKFLIAGMALKIHESPLHYILLPMKI